MENGLCSSVANRASCGRMEAKHQGYRAEHGKSRMTRCRVGKVASVCVCVCGGGGACVCMCRCGSARPNVSLKSIQYTAIIPQWLASVIVRRSGCKLYKFTTVALVYFAAITVHTQLVVCCLLSRGLVDVEDNGYG